jgi:protein involved in polysaccharide export with SLBB domain
MQITLVFTYASGQEYGLTVDSYRLFRTEGKVQFKIGKVDDEYILEPGDKVDVYAVGYMATIKRNKV